MKKGLVFLSLFLLLVLVSIYVFIPAKLLTSANITVNANSSALFRHLSNQSRWNRWWPQKSTVSNLGDYSYVLKQKLYNAVDVEIRNKKNIISSKIIIIPLAVDSLIIQWNSVLATSIDPFVRLKQYSARISNKKNMIAILNNLKSFAEDKDKVYNYNLRHTTLTDTLFVAIKTVTTGYPSTEVMYENIERLRRYIRSKNANEVNYPIANITKKDSVHYDIMVAIPTDIALSDYGDISFKRMFVYKDKILTADVTGGPEEIEKGYKELNSYMSDYHLVSPVIHWETLITDRSKEKDSTKWSTRICIPIV